MDTMYMALFLGIAPKLWQMSACIMSLLTQKKIVLQ